MLKLFSVKLVPVITLWSVDYVLVIGLPDITSYGCESCLPEMTRPVQLMLSQLSYLGRLPYGTVAYC